MTCKIKNRIKKTFDCLKLVVATTPFAFLFSFAFVLLRMLIPVSVAALWNNLLHIESANLKLQFLILALVGGFGRGVSQIGEFADAYFRDRSALKLQKRVHKKAQKLDIGDYEDPEINDSIWHAQSLFFYGLGTGLVLSTIYVAASLIGLIMSLIFVAKSTWLVFAAFLLFVFTHFLAVSLMQESSLMQFEKNKYDRVSKLFMKYLSSFKYLEEIWVCRLHQYLAQKWAKELKKVQEKEGKVTKRIIKYKSMINMLIALAYALLFFSMYKSYNDGALSLAMLSSLILLSLTINDQTEVIVEQISGFVEVSDLLEGGLEFFAFKEKEASKKASLAEKNITLKNVSYTYPAAKEPSLKNINLELDSSKRYAVVGKNGAGDNAIMMIVQ